MSDLEPKPVESGESAREPSSGASRLLRLWFGFHAEVSRSAYAATGLGLTVFKYGFEAFVLWCMNGVVFTPLAFLNPVLSAREELIAGVPDWLGWAWFAWTLPFLWIAVTMSVRRAARANLTPWVGLLVLVPAVNLLTMLGLAVAPDRARRSVSIVRDQASAIHGVRSAIIGVSAGLCIALAMVGVGVYAFSNYGASLFFGTPIVMGVVGSVIYNAAAPRSVSSSIMLGMLTVILAGVALLLFALEGVICILMAAPIAIPLGGFGGAIGKAISEVTMRSARGMTTAIVLLPLWSGVESAYVTCPEYLVVSQIEIDAPPQAVWNYVVDFPELDAPDEWYFRLGISCPMSARIIGHGVGAERQCVFTTGVFVEPITLWDEPRRLAFDVTDQPAPMFELSPYHHIHPPHLDGVMKSNRGEFRLVPLPNGGTRLEGRTWYELDMFPQYYWTLWSDVVVHRIHDRVLVHIKQLAEKETHRVAP